MSRDMKITFMNDPTLHEMLAEVSNEYGYKPKESMVYILTVFTGMADEKYRQIINHELALQTLLTDLTKQNQAMHDNLYNMVRALTVYNEGNGVASDAYLKELSNIQSPESSRNLGQYSFYVPNPVYETIENTCDEFNASRSGKTSRLSKSELIRSIFHLFVRLTWEDKEHLLQWGRYKVVVPADIAGNLKAAYKKEIKPQRMFNEIGDKLIQEYQRKEHLTDIAQEIDEMSQALNNCKRQIDKLRYGKENY